MKEYVNKMIEIAMSFVNIASGNNCYYSGEDVEVWHTSDGEPMITFYDLIEVIMWKKNDNKIEFNIKDVSRIDEIPKIIGAMDTYLDDIKNTIKISHD